MALKPTLQSHSHLADLRDHPNFETRSACSSISGHCRTAAAKKAFLPHLHA
jgi:hypothetical protein